MKKFPTCAILAGGLGTRLREAVPDAPKSVALVAGQPFLVLLMRQLRQAGARRVILCTGYRAAQVDREIGTNFEGMEILYSVEDHPLGTGGALRLAWTRYGQSQEQDGWIVTNGDSYADLDWKEFWMDHGRSGLEASLAAVEVADGSRYGSLTVGPSSRLIRFGEKEAESRDGLISAGIYALGRVFLDSLETRQPLSLERDVFPSWIPKGIHVFSRKTRFIDIGTPDSYLAAQRFFAQTPAGTGGE